MRCRAETQVDIAKSCSAARKLLGQPQSTCAPQHKVLWIFQIQINPYSSETAKSLTLGSMGRLSRWRSHLASQCGPSAAWSPAMSLS